MSYRPRRRPRGRGARALHGVVALLVALLVGGLVAGPAPAKKRLPACVTTKVTKKVKTTKKQRRCTKAKVKKKTATRKTTTKAPAARAPAAPTKPAATQTPATSPSQPTAPSNTATSAPADTGGPADDGPAAPAPAATPTPAAGGVLARFSYENGLSSWRGVQQPAGETRITTATPPTSGTDALGTFGTTMRVEVRPEDRTITSGNYIASRSEVYARNGQPWSLPATRWPDPVGSVRWYAINLFFPEDFVTATDYKWMVVTQWKGYHGGSPPVALEIKKDHIFLGGTKPPKVLTASRQDLGPIVRGQWTRIVVGLSLSDDPAAGWVEAWRDGTLEVPRTTTATMDTIDGAVDPIYLKQGIYRTKEWTVPHVLYLGPTTIAATREDVLR